MVVAFVALASVALSTASAGAHPANAHDRSAGETTTAPYFVYWDQNEEEDFVSMPSGTLGQLVPPYNANGQMCLIPAGGGSFVTAYNPTTDPTNPGYYKTQMQPPIGEAVWDKNGNFTGQTIYVPGPYMLPGQTVGGDIPPDGSGNFNNDGTFTGSRSTMKAISLPATSAPPRVNFPHRTMEGSSNGSGHPCPHTASSMVPTRVE